MNPFVNLRKRSVQLPKGCKDLIDVLRSSTSQNTASGLFGDGEPMPKPDAIETGGLADIERYTSRLLRSAAKIRSLQISSLDGQVALALLHHDGGLTVTVFCDRKAHERAVRKLFARAGIEPTLDYAVNNAGVSTRGLSYPLLGVASDAAKLTAELLRKPYGLGDNSGLNFLYEEREST